MAHREFVDEAGTAWQAWEVIPQSAERRSDTERRFGSRAAPDRRVVAGHRIHMEDGLGEGWLVFECAHEKRRLHPIPEHWSQGTERELRALCSSASAAPRVSPSDDSP